MIQMYLPVLMIFILLTTGCAAPVFQEGYQTRSYFGWITVIEKMQDESQSKVESIKSLGLSIGRSFGIGYFEDTRIILPLDCGMVIFVKDLDQMENLFKTYPQLRKGDNPCIKPNAP